jgi:uncharacterized membrane protein (UPF0136 family)
LKQIASFNRKPKKTLKGEKQMGNILIFSLLAGIISSILLIPFSKMTKETKITGIAMAFTITVVLIVFGFFYITKLDQNFSTLWPLLLVVSMGGAFASKGMERKIKGVISVVSLGVGIYFLTAFVFNADEKFDLSKMDEKVEIAAFDESVTPASVPPQFARNKMRKAFGQVPNTSYYELGNLQIQKVDGQFVYIAPVEFSGFFKWFKGDETPGYFTLSATDSSANPKFVKTNMTYTPSSFFQKNVERHIRLSYPKKIFYGDVQLEIDDEGKPYYIRTYGSFVSARNGFKAEGIVLVEPSTGKTEAFNLASAPEFLDGSVSPEAVSLQNSYYGNFVHGFWNSVFGKSDVKLPSDEGTEANVSPVFDENGVMYYFTDFTSPKEGVDSMLGYSLTNARTGKATFYTGNLEESYMDSRGALDIIEKKFIEKKWDGEMPVLYNFYGEASWLTPVLDSNGFLQNYFIVSAANPEISSYAETPNEALKKYKVALQRVGSTLNGSSKAEEKKTSGEVLRVFKERIGDYTIVSFLLNNQQNFTVSSENNPLAIYLERGDQVSITYLDSGEEFLPVKKLTIQGIQ